MITINEIPDFLNPMPHLEILIYTKLFKSLTSKKNDQSAHTGNLLFTVYRLNIILQLQNHLQSRHLSNIDL
jgi:hypothetical protein